MHYYKSTHDTPLMLTLFIDRFGRGPVKLCQSQARTTQISIRGASGDVSSPVKAPNSSFYAPEIVGMSVVSNFIRPLK